MTRLAPPVFGAEICGRWGGVREYDDGTTVTHWAYDLCFETGAPPVYNLVAGRVVDVLWSTHGGNQVVMQWGPRIFARHSHLERPLVRIGQMLPRYGIVGLAGQTGVNRMGRPISRHLHLQMMDRYPSNGDADPINMPEWLHNYGIEEQNRMFVWREGYPRRRSGLPALAVGALGSGAVLALSRVLPR